MNYIWTTLILNCFDSHEEQPNIPYILHNFSESDEDYKFICDKKQDFGLSSSCNIQCHIFERMSFLSKEAAMMNIKQNHIEQGYIYCC